MSDLAPETPHIQQTLRLPVSKLEAFQEWATEGSGLTASARVRDPDGRIALIQNRWTDGWFLPGGEVESGESPKEAARREVREETSLDATIEAPLVVLEQAYVSEEDGEEWFPAQFVVYAAFAEGEIPDASQLGMGDGEILSAQWFDTVPNNFQDGEILRPYL